VSAKQADLPVQTMCRAAGLGQRLLRLASAGAIVAGDCQRCPARAHPHHPGQLRRHLWQPRVRAELIDQGQRVSRKRIARLMRRAGLRGVSRRRGFTVTTQRDRAQPQAPDLVRRRFVAETPNALWVADMTYVPTWAGFIFLAVVIDAWSRCVVGWAIGERMTAELVLAALNMALEERRPNAVIHHSEQGCQYTSVAFGNRSAAMGERPSMSSVGDAYDNAMAESFFASLECELLDRRSFQSKPRRGWRSSAGSRAGTTRGDGTLVWATCRRPTSNASTIHPASTACPLRRSPPASYGPAAAPWTSLQPR
jgi:transposase InsO family protein